eukprot:GHVP01049060.1.p1 GENE.GHVP01049060.1~~GHVP01049060.1.p1  ORF type:complete len:227 (+),score=29.92 GHVP01049060.1:170-850(+)
MFFFLLKGAIGVHIISVSNEPCAPRNLPFPATCATNCVDRDLKPFCLEYALRNTPHLSDDEIILYADADVILSNWTEARLTQVLKKFGTDKIVFNAERGASPKFFQKNTDIKIFNDLNAGVMFGRKKLLLDLVTRIQDCIEEHSVFKLFDNSTNPPKDVHYFNWRRTADQEFWASFYQNSRGKPIVTDTEREVTFLAMDLWKTKKGVDWDRPKPGQDICLKRSFGL